MKLTAYSLLIALVVTAGCISYIAAFHRSWDAPSGKQSVSVVGLSGLGTPYSGVNDKNADTYLYERSTPSADYHLHWHKKIPIHNIGDMEVECRWSGDRLVHLLFYDYGTLDRYDALQAGASRKFVTAIRVEKAADGRWTYRVETQQETMEQSQQ